MNAAHPTLEWKKFFLRTYSNGLTIIIHGQQANAKENVNFRNAFDEVIIVSWYSITTAPM